ncbi:MAG: glycoside hydrolase family 9 protein [Ignavibacteriales bacterium]
MRIFYRLFLLTLFVLVVDFPVLASQNFYFRLNQLGFLPEDIKTAVIMSRQNLSGKKYEIVEQTGKKVILSSILNNGIQGAGNFSFNYVIDFSSIRKPGKFFISCEGRKSSIFSIGGNIYDSIADSLLLFFKVQRCGYTNPLLHGVCHPADATRIINKDGPENNKIDVTGGWHDAGDYVKFLNTTAFTTYLLLFSYEFDPVKFGFDSDKNGIPDILEEAKIGLDWLLRANVNDNRFITQVQDLRDHDQGWRMPEKDQLAFDRPGFTGTGKNLTGIYTAVMSLASRIWKEKLQYNEFADKCLNTAIKVYSLRSKVPDLDKSGTGMYQDSKYAGKLALGAVELYQSTKQREYLADAIGYADQAKSDFWWSWGDINSLADYKIAKYEPRFKDYIFNNLKLFNDTKNKNVFGEAAGDSWGSNNAVLGCALQAILWKKLTGNNSFDSLTVYQRDFILGKNQWGISFIYNIGTSFSKNFHSQISFFKRGYLPGAVAAGPISRKKLESYKIEMSGKDPLKQFQTEAAVYQDIRTDYVTNEPTITTNATAVFVFGYFSGKR